MIAVLYSFHVFLNLKRSTIRRFSAINSEAVAAGDYMLELSCLPQVPGIAFETEMGTENETGPEMS